MFADEAFTLLVMGLDPRLALGEKRHVLSEFGVASARAIG